MKTYLLCCSLFGLLNLSPALLAQSTAFSYQGRLLQDGNPANGTYDFRFRLAADPQGGTYVGSPTITNGLAVSGGLFSTPLDFGAVFTGSNYWLEISVRTNGANGYATLGPLQPITPAPTALYASQIAAGAVQASSIATSAVGTSQIADGAVTGAKVASGTIGAVNVDPATFDTTFWKASGNQGTKPGTQFIGTLDQQPLEFKVAGQRALRLEPITNGLVNVIGGSALNYVSAGAVGATIGGGGGIDPLVIGGMSNSVSGNFSTVSGGENNVTYNGNYSTVAGGFGNSATNDQATVSGGLGNIAGGVESVVGGGIGNIASGYDATVPGGYYNIASANNSFAAGYRAQALHPGSFVWSDDTLFAGVFSSTAPDQFSVRASGGIRLAGNVQFEGDGEYHRIEMSGGNSLGYLYASFPALADGIHLGYNYYWDTTGAGHIIRTDGGTSRVTVGYGEIVLAVGAVNTHPTTVRLDANTSGVSVYGTFNNSSDRNAKQDFSSISPSAILDKVVELPISEWSYKEDAQTRHIGPMGQDFYSLFKLGTDEKHIAPIDEGGVALAAIQGLNQKLEEKEARIRSLERTVSELKDLVATFARSPKATP